MFDLKSLYLLIILSSKPFVKFRLRKFEYLKPTIMNSNHQIITDKYEMHEIAIESSLSEHKDIIHIDLQM